MEHVKVFEVWPLSPARLGGATPAERTYITQSSCTGLVRSLFIDTQRNGDSCVGLWECSKQRLGALFFIRVYIHEERPATPQSNKLFLWTSALPPTNTQSGWKKEKAPADTFTLGAMTHLHPIILLREAKKWKIG